MERYCICWLDKTDIKASLENFSGVTGPGPILNSIAERNYSSVFILNGYSNNQEADSYFSKLEEKLTSNISINQFNVEILSPIDFKSIYDTSSFCIKQIPEFKSKANLDILISTGSSVMHGVWFILSNQLKFELPSLNIKLITSSQESGVETLSLSDAHFSSLAETIARKENQVPIKGNAFETIIGKSDEITEVKEKAKTIAKFIRENVIIEGKTGTGKEHFARAIHDSSKRASKPFDVINCGSMNEDLFRSEMFGYKAGSFTGANKDKDGLLVKLDGGSLFLDELSDLSLENQKDLLRFLEDGKVTPIGGSDLESSQVDIRIIGASNKTLAHQVSKGLFREDLFFRLNVFTINLPDLKDRQGDIKILSNHFLKELNEDFSHFEEFEKKKLSSSAFKVLEEHKWPGNVRELKATLKRVCALTKSSEVNDNDIKKHLVVGTLFDSIQPDAIRVSLEPPYSPDKDPFEKFLGESFDIRKLMNKLQRHYVSLALEKAKNKRQAAKLLGLSQQNMEDWIKRLGIKTD